MCGSSLSQADEAIMADLAHTEDDPTSFDEYFEYFIGKFGQPPVQGDVGDARRARFESQSNPLVGTVPESMATVNKTPATGETLVEKLLARKRATARPVKEKPRVKQDKETKKKQDLSCTGSPDEDPTPRGKETSSVFGKIKAFF